MSHPGAALFPLGSSWTVLQTDRNLKNGLTPGTRVWLTFADGTHFSIALDTVEQERLKVPRVLFGVNFEPIPLRPIAPAFIGRTHATRLYD